MTTLEDIDLGRLTKAMNSYAEPVMSAGIFPPHSIVLRFAAYFPEGTPFSYILLRLHAISLMHPRFHLCSLKTHVQIADSIEPVRNLTISDRIIFCSAPADKDLLSVLQSYAKCVANGKGGELIDMPELGLSVLNEGVIKDKTYLPRLEILHRALVLYIWLSYRFAGVFTNKALAFYTKSILEKKIEDELANVSLHTKRAAYYIRQLQRKALERSEQPQCEDETRSEEQENNTEDQISGSNPSCDEVLGVGM